MIFMIHVSWVKGMFSALISEETEEEEITNYSVVLRIIVELAMSRKRNDRTDK